MSLPGDWWHVKVKFKKWQSSIHTWQCIIFMPKILVTVFSHHRSQFSIGDLFCFKFWWPFLSHHHLLTTFFTHYLLHICTLAHLPSLMELWSSPLQTYMWRSAALEKLEVAEQRSSALHLTLTTGWHNLNNAIYEMAEDSTLTVLIWSQLSTTQCPPFLQLQIPEHISYNSWNSFSLKFLISIKGISR